MPVFSFYINFNFSTVVFLARVLVSPETSGQVLEKRGNKLIFIILAGLI